MERLNSMSGLATPSVYLLPKRNVEKFLEVAGASIPHSVSVPVLVMEMLYL